MLQSFLRVKKLRGFYLLYEEPDNFTDDQKSRLLLTQSMSQLFRKIWNPINFKNHVSPHELVQAVTLKSKKMFSIGKQGDPIKFYSWLVNNLHTEMKDKNGRSIIFDLFQGEMEVKKQIFNDVAGKLVEKETVTSKQPFL